MVLSARFVSARVLLVLSAGSLIWMRGLTCLSQIHERRSPFLVKQNLSTRRRDAFGWLIATGGATFLGSPAWGAAAVQDTMSVDSFLRTGVDIGGNMGVSSQAGKTKPVTGVFLR
jgi:hypothetical protein